MTSFVEGYDEQRLADASANILAGKPDGHGQYRIVKKGRNYDIQRLEESRFLWWKLGTVWKTADNPLFDNIDSCYRWIAEDIQIRAGWQEVEVL